MKKIIIPIMIVVTMFIGSCSKVVIFDPSDDEIKLYSRVYMPRASEGVVIKAISTTGEDQTTIYSAYLGGPIDAPNDINITFAVDAKKVAEYNSENGTDYKLLPESSYTIESLQAVINKGTRSTEDFEFVVKPGNYLNMFDTYLLPLTISEVKGTSLNEELSTIYYVFRVTYQPGQVPREKVLSLGTNWGNILTNGARGSLVLRDLVNDIYNYMPDSEGKFSTPPRRIGINWDATESFYYINETSMVARNTPYWAGLFNFRIAENHDLINVPDPNFWLGDFWDKYVIIPFKQYFLLVDGTGVMLRQPSLSRVDVPKTQVGSGFNVYKQILTFGDSILALETNGKLWLYQVSDLGVPGARKQLGEGWNMYEKIIVSGADILALDDNGDVYRYEINPIGYYPVK